MLAISLKLQGDGRLMHMHVSQRRGPPRSIVPSSATESLHLMLSHWHFPVYLAEHTAACGKSSRKAFKTRLSVTQDQAWGPRVW